MAGHKVAMNSSSASARKHPLLNISKEEVLRASKIALRCVRARENNKTLEVRFKNISLHEPAKAVLLPYLNAEAAGVPIHKRPFVPRCVEVVYSAENEQIICESIISLDSETECGLTKAGKGQHSSIDR